MSLQILSRKSPCHHKASSYCYEPIGYWKKGIPVQYFKSYTFLHLAIMNALSPCTIVNHQQRVGFKEKGAWCPIFPVHQAHWPQCHGHCAVSLPRRDGWGQGNSPDMLLQISKQLRLLLFSIVRLIIVFFWKCCKVWLFFVHNYTFCCNGKS